MKIRCARANLFHADIRTDDQTDITQLKVAFRKFAKAPKKRQQLSPDITPTFARRILWRYSEDGSVWR